MDVHSSSMRADVKRLEDQVTWKDGVMVFVCLTPSNIFNPVNMCICPLFLYSVLSVVPASCDQYHTRHISFYSHPALKQKASLLPGRPVLRLELFLASTHPAEVSSTTLRNWGGQIRNQQVVVGCRWEEWKRQETKSERRTKSWQTAG